MQSDKLEERILDLNGILTQIGQGRDALYQFAEEDYIEFGINFNEYNFQQWAYSIQRLYVKQTTYYPEDRMLENSSI